MKEVGVAPSARVMLFTLPLADGSAGVVSTGSQPGENGKSAALRALTELAAVNPMPDLDFMTPAGSASDGHSVNVAAGTAASEREGAAGRRQLGRFQGREAVRWIARSHGNSSPPLPADTCFQTLAREYLNPWLEPQASLLVRHCCLRLIL